MVDFYHDRQVDVLKSGYTLPGIANKILHNSTTSKFHPFQSRDLDWVKRVRENVVGGPSIVFCRYAEAGKTKIRKDGDKTCETIVGVDASQLYPYAMCQPMPCGPYTRWDFQEGEFKAKRDWRSQLEKTILCYWSSIRPQCKIQCLHSDGKQRRIGPYLVDGFCAHCNTCLLYTSPSPRDS